jgi:cytochrome c biogenesis factor
VRQRRGRWSDVAHAGVLVLVLGVGVSTFDRVATDSVAAGGATSIAGADVANERLEVGPGSRLGTEAVTAVLDVDGQPYEPSLVVYPERAARLAEVAVRTGLWTDIHVVLDGADDDGTVVLTVHRRHGMWLVWVGAAAVAVATLVLGPRTARRRRDLHPGAP